MYRYISDVDEILSKYLNTLAQDSSKPFYKARVMKFFNEYMSSTLNKNRPLNTLHYFDVVTYLNNLESDHINYYYAFKGFFGYTYRSDITKDIITGVEKPEKKKSDFKYISPDEISKFIKYIENHQYKLIERLSIAFFLYTGLSRQYIANLLIYQININSERHECTLHFDLGEQGEVFVPIKPELTKLIEEYMNLQGPVVKQYDRLFEKYDKNYISKKISDLSQKVVGKRYCPTDFSSTFIKNSIIAGNDFYTISTCVLETVGTIEKHVPDKCDLGLYGKQTKLLDSLYSEK